MADETLLNPEIHVAKVAENIESNSRSVKVTKENFKQMKKEEHKKEEEEETSFDGEFIKVEKEPIDAKDHSDASQTDVAADEKLSVFKHTANDPDASRKLLESQENVRELENELLRISSALKESESENTNLKDELLLTKEKHREAAKKHDELGLHHKKLIGQISETEERYSLRLKTLQGALDAQEHKHKQLINVKEAFDSLHLELEISRKKIDELEFELQSSTSEARKFEDLHKESGLQAESETKKVLEFEKLLELAKSSAKEMEGQMVSLQDELKSLYEKIAENQKVEEALKSVTSELSTVHGELELAKSQLQDAEQKLALREALIDELTQELELKRAFDSKTKEDMASLENLLGLTKENHQEKVSELEDVNLKLKQEIITKEKVGEHLNNEQTKMKIFEEELAKVIKEKEALEEAVINLTNNTAQMKELCTELEDKLKKSDENCCKADSLLSEAVVDNKELEQKLKALEELHNETVRTLNAAVEEAKAELRETESRCTAAEQRTTELEQQLNLEGLQSHDYQRELRELSYKISELNAALEKEVDEKQQLETKFQESQTKVVHMEYELSTSKARSSEIEKRADMIHQRSLELEDLIQASESKAADAVKKVSELELLLETEKYRIKELEEQIMLLETNCEDLEAEFMKSGNQVSELELQLQVVRSEASDLEAALQASTEKEKELSECLRITTEENINLKDASKSSNEKLFEAENLLDVLRNELSISQQRLESIENALKAAAMQESELTEKLKLAEVLTRESELKLQEAIGNFTNKDSEAKALHDKVDGLEDQVKSSEEQLMEAAERYETVKKELDQILIKLSYSEDSNEDLKRKILEAEAKAGEYALENISLSETNALLNGKVKDLEEKLTAAASEMEVSNKQLTSHMNTVAELTERHSNVAELHLAAEAQLEAAMEKFTLKDLEAKELYEKLKAFEARVERYEEEAQEASTLSKSRKLEFEQNSNQFEKENQALVEANLKLTQDLASYESNLSNLQTMLFVVSSEKDETVEELNNARKEVEELKQQLASESQELQSQISSIMEENNLLNESYQSSKTDLQTIILNLEEQLKEQKSNEDDLKAKLEFLNSEVGQKIELQSHLMELEEQLAKVEARLKEEKELSSQKELEREASLKHSFEELRAKRKEVQLLENKVKELEQTLQKADAKSKEKDVGGTTPETKDEVAKSREIESFTSTPSKRKHKKKSEATSAGALSSGTSATQVQTNAASPIMTLKFTLGVALVSVIFGIILGKRY